MKASKTPQERVKKYYNGLESRLGYMFLLKGTKHFGYYPKGEETITMDKAQLYMEEKLGEALDLKPGSLVLDAGCGEGKVAISLAKKFKLKIIGIDLLSWAIRRAKENTGEEKFFKMPTFQLMDYTYLFLIIFLMQFIQWKHLFIHQTIKKI